MQEIWQAVSTILGLQSDSKDLIWYQIVLRGIIIYLAGLFIVRLSNKRFLGQNSAFDVFLFFALGAMLSRAINGSEKLFGSIIGGFAMVGIHWLFAILSYHSHKLGDLLKGHTIKLVEDGRMLTKPMRHTYITEHDLMEAIRSKANMSDISQVKEAVLERSGEISVVKAENSQEKIPRILEIHVEEGVQTIRIKLE